MTFHMKKKYFKCNKNFLFSSLNIVYPMLFKLTNEGRGRSTHCGVLEFVADEGMMYIPYWMLQNLQLEEGELCKVHQLLKLEKKP